jgi:ubiquinone/menaquinone biosynthesis C-methylase UbiE
MQVTDIIKKLLFIGPHRCPAWLSFALESRLRHLAHNPVKLLGPWLKEGQTALDMGCGPGYFTLPMAHMVGDTGKVIAVDIQEAMLERVRRRAARDGLAARMSFLASLIDDPSILGTVDFALAFWMVHEVSDRTGLLQMLRRCMKPGGLLFIVEPKGHVSKKSYDALVYSARSSGFMRAGEPEVALSRAILLRAD